MQDVESTKRILQLVIAASMLVCCSSSTYHQHPTYTLTGKQTGYNYKVSESGSEWHQYGLTLELRTNVSDLHPIYLMTCSWTKNAKISDDRFALGTGCDANFMSWVRIRPNEFLELKTIVQPKASTSKPTDKIRIALIAIDTTEVDWLGPLEEFEGEMNSLREQEHRYIWSNEIELKELERIEAQPWGQWAIKKESI